MWTRLKALIVKELLAALRDPRARVILIVPPIVQLLVFSYAATLEVKNVDVAVLNRDVGYWSSELMQRVGGAPTFRRVVLVDRPEALRQAIDLQQVLAAIQIGPSFSADLAAGRPASLQIILDGRRSNAAQIVAGYLNRIVTDLGADAASSAGRSAAPATTVPRNWFNPNLDFIWFTVPNLIAVIALLIGLISTPRTFTGCQYQCLRKTVV